MAQPIYLIRHAEKPDAKAGILGVGFDGHADPQSLSPRGWQRAGALAACFGTSERAVAFHPLLQKPADLFAAADAGRSRRPEHTLRPLAELIDRPVCLVPSEGDPVAVAAKIRACTGPVLVCWRHRELPILARALLPRHAQRVPERWDEQRFDLIWVIRTDDIVVIAQRLLAGDSTFAEEGAASELPFADESS